MSAATLTESAFGRWWRKWRFHLSALVILAPIALVPAYFREVESDSGASGLGAREIGELKAGPWTVRLAEFDLSPPLPQGPAGPVKTFTLALEGDAISQVRAAYVKLGKPRSLRAAGWAFFGSPYRQIAGTPIPERTPIDAELWLTLEGWDGSVRHASLPLAQASPVTIDWLKSRGADK